MSTLYFRFGKLEGFTSSSLSDKKEGYAVPIRELLQNSLDASHQAGNDKCEVDIYIEEIPMDEIPCIGEYKDTLAKAIATQKSEDSYNHNSQQTVAFIESELKRESIKVLMFVDNGVGMDPKTIDALLDERSRKSEEGAGSFGVGHLTSYRLSLLRYVLYATKYKDNGSAKILFTGSPILAGHQDKDADRGSSGRIVQEQPENERKPNFVYPTEFPGFIASKMQSVDTGSMIAIVGLSEEWGRMPNTPLSATFSTPFTTTS